MARFFVPVLAAGLVGLAVWLPAGSAEAQRGVTPVPAERRVALVIGNGAYPEAPLRNPVNDARGMATALRRLGFEVIERHDANQRQMQRAIGEFGRKLGGGAVGLVFYAGHGIQVSGRNYLIPVDATIQSEADVGLEAIDVDRVLEQIRENPLNLVILDACRNNPFERRWRSGGGAGLAAVLNAPTGTLIAYATAPGKVASDGEGANGLYTSELLKAIETPGLKVEDVFKRVRAAVARQTRSEQIPWEVSSLTGDFYFVPPAAAAPAAAASVAAAPAPPAPAPAVAAAPPERPASAPPRPAQVAPPVQAGVAPQPALPSQTALLPQATPPAAPVTPAPATHECDRLAGIWERDTPGAREVPTEQIDGARAVVACRSAVERFPGVPRYQVQYGRALAKAGDDAGAVSRYRKAVESGHPRAQSGLGVMYATGRGGLTKDEAEAVRWYRLSADQGDPSGQANLGLMYANGRGGLPKDDAEAVRWYRRAAEQGFALGQNLLGWMYDEGRGVLKDEAEAVRWYRRAADQGLAAGQNNVGWMYAGGRGGLAKDEAEAARWYRRAAEQGNAVAQTNLGFLYADGRGGLPKDEAEAVRWHRRAAEQGNARGQNALGWMYDQGRGVPKDDAEAVRWYRLAADQGNETARNNLKRMCGVLLKPATCPK